jgi:hypothetical protein
MSNAKRIQKKVAKLEKRKYYTFAYFLAKIDTLAFELAIENFRKGIEETRNELNKYTWKHEQL